MIPPRPYGTALLMRATGLWFVLRAILVVMLPVRIDHAGAAVGPSLYPVTAASVVVAVVMLGWLDIRRRGEWIPLANLGVGRAATALPLAAPPVVFESILIGVVA